MFQLQSELVEVKVDMAVSKTIERVLERIDECFAPIEERFVRIHDDIHRLEVRISAAETSLKAAETSLNDLKKITDQVRTRVLDYGIKALWIMVGSSCVYVASLAIHFA